MFSYGLSGTKVQYTRPGEKSRTKVTIEDFSPPAAARPFMCELLNRLPQAADSATHSNACELPQAVRNQDRLVRFPLIHQGCVLVKEIAVAFSVSAEET